jgi:predicted membrane protein
MAARQERHVVIGLIILALGVVWLLQNLSLITVSIGQIIATYWPAVLVLWGLEVVIREWRWQAEEGNKKSFPAYLSGLILVLLGLAILGGNLHFYRINFALCWKIFWPLVIILVGVGLLHDSGNSGARHWAVLSGIDLKNRGWKLENGSYFAFMGGIDMDTTVAEFPEGEVALNLQAFMGGIEVVVPPDIEVDCHGTAVLGGIEFLREECGGLMASRVFHSPGAPESRKKLVIHASAIMGGITVKRESY